MKEGKKWKRKEGRGKGRVEMRGGGGGGVEGRIRDAEWLWSLLSDSPCAFVIAGLFWFLLVADGWERMSVRCQFRSARPSSSSPLASGCLGHGTGP